MKVAIVFYSETGNTKQICGFLRRKLEIKNIEGVFIEIEPKNKFKNMIDKILASRFKRTVELKKVQDKLWDYNFLVIAAPVWAMALNPVMRSYLAQADGFSWKNIACFLTCNDPSGTFGKKALKDMEDLLKEKKCQIVFSKLIGGAKAKDEKFLEEQFAPLFEMIK